MRSEKMNMQTKAPVKNSPFYALLGLVLLTALVYFYAAFSFSSVFAKTTVSIPGVHFPVFVGEVFLLCAGLSALACVLRGYRVPSWKMNVMMVFGLWIAVKAVLGFKIAGAFAFRNAALFYYPFTAVMVYYFIYCLKRGSASQYFINTRSWSRQFLLVFLGLILSFPAFSLDIYPFAQFCICLVLPVIIFYVRNPLLKIVLGVCFICALVKSGVFACVSRSHLLSVFAGLLFLAVYFFLLFGGTALKKFKWIFLFGLLVLLGAVTFFSDRNAIKSMASPLKIVEQFLYFDGVIQQRELTYENNALQVCTYADPEAFNGGAESRHDCVWTDFEHPATAQDQLSFRAASLVVEDQHLTKQETKNSYQGHRTLGTAYVNILFRAFIWRDMWTEYWREKPIMGFGFEKAQRSRSLEILSWAESAWLKDGWIAPHNSYLHVFYRGGIVGVLCILTVFVLVVRMTRTFFSRRSIVGGLLMTAVIFGLVSANFLLFLEVPYTAIPFWYVFGLTAAYERWLIKRS